jgi:23S rRNA pseudouridine1911/1915/1917 synthase
LRRLTLRVERGDAGERLDRFVAARGGISRGLARRVLERGGVFLDGRRCKVASRAVREGHRVVVNLEEAGRAAERPLPLDGARLLYADEHLVAVDKPPFVPAQPTLTSDVGALPELAAALVGGEVILVHRLDRETSGVTVLARSRAAARGLAEAFRAGEVEKTYLALTARAPSPPLGRLDAPLAPDPSRPGRRRVSPEGEPAATRYETLRAAPSLLPALPGGEAGPGPGEGGALVICWPESGRTHQIRAHLAHLGAPLLGDPRYGGPRRVLETSIPRVMLHARRLSLRHPATGRRLLFEAPVPEDFLAVAWALVPASGGGPEMP